MEKGQIKSRQRVSDLGEVFTNEREVKAMCDLVKDETYRIDSRILEPACGNGNFLAEILKRKLETVSYKCKKNPSEWEKYSILAISSLYGIDIMGDNTQECRSRLYNIWNCQYSKYVGNKGIADVLDSVKFIIEQNIICANALTLKDVNNDAIIFPEWDFITESLIKRSDFELSSMLDVLELGYQGDLFLSSDVYDKDVGSYVSKAIKEYAPVEYWRIQCQN